MAREKSSDALIARGLQKLQDAGLPADNGRADRIGWLKEHVGSDQETDLAIVYLLGKTADPRAVDELLEIEKSAADKALKKEIRRSLFKLGQRGLKVTASPLPEARVVSLSATLEIEAFISAVDGGGGRLIWIAKPEPGHGLYVIQAMINDRVGLQRVGAAQVKRKELRRMADEIKADHGIEMVPVPWEYADEALYHAYEKGKGQAGSGTERFHEIRGVLFSARPKPQEHPIYRVLDSKAVREGAWRELSRRLLDEPELRYWLADQDWVQPFFSQIQEAQSSRLVLNPMQKEERLAAIVRDAVKETSNGEPGTIMRRRLEDMAFYFVRTGREDSAKLALAVALQIGDGGPGPLDVSFLTGLVQKTFSVYLSEEKSKATEEPSLIFKP